MPIFIKKKFSSEFLPNFKVAEFEFEFEPGDLDCSCPLSCSNICPKTIFVASTIKKPPLSEVSNAQELREDPQSASIGRIDAHCKILSWKSLKLS